MDGYEVRRPANVTPQEARDGLARKWPKARIASFKVSEDGSEYIATLKFAGEPPFAAKDEAADEAPESPAEDKAPEGEDEGPDAGGEDEPDGDDAPPFGKDKGGEKKPGEGKDSGADKQILHLLTEIAKALGIASVGPEGDEPALPPHAGPADGPAPEDAGPVPPPAAPAIPPPAKPKGPGAPGLGQPFSSVQDQQRIAALRAKVANRRTFTTVVQAGEEMKLRDAVQQAAIMYPEFKVAHIERRTGRVNGGQTEPLIVIAMRRK